MDIRITKVETDNQGWYTLNQGKNTDNQGWYPYNQGWYAHY